MLPDMRKENKNASMSKCVAVGRYEVKKELVRELCIKEKPPTLLILSGYATYIQFSLQLLPYNCPFTP
jgi:hypothetical protein